MAIYSDTIVGLDDLIKDFLKLPDEAVKYVERASEESGEKVLRDTKALVPVLTGNLRDDLRLRKPNMRRKKKYIIFSQVTFTKQAGYATSLELGHKKVLWGKKTGGKVQERPFMRPAADANRQYVTNIMAEAMSRALRDFGAKGV